MAVLDGDRVVGGASVLFRRLPLDWVTLAYIPKGPVVNWDDASLVVKLFEGLDRLCQTRRAFALKIEPDLEAKATPEIATFPTRPVIRRVCGLYAKT